MEKNEIRVYTAQDSLQADMILETLKNNGIPAYKKDLGYASVMNIYGGYSNGGEEIYVADGIRPEGIKAAVQSCPGISVLTNPFNML